MSQTFIAYIKIALAMAIVGSSVVVGKLVIASFPIYLASELRFVISTLILLPLLLRQGQRFPRIRPKDLLLLFLQALTGVFLFNVFMLNGLKLTTAIEAGIITSIIPAVVGLVAFLFLREKLSLNKGLGIFLAVLGVLFINLVGGVAGSNSSMLGNLLIVGAVICETLFITIGKSVTDRVTPLAISTMMSIFGLLLFLPMSIYEATRFDFSAVTAMDWVNILYFGIFVTVIAFLFMYQGLSKVPASTAGVLTSMIPISSIFLSFIILGEEVTWVHLLGVLFILIAIVLIARSSAESQSEVVDRTASG
ncbi:MAG: DMT family transporter [Candidatus Pristimantibacillus sp.]